MCLAALSFARVASAQPADLASEPRRTSVVLVTRATGPDHALADEVADAIEASLAADGVELRTLPPRAQLGEPTDLVSMLESASDAYAHLRLEEASTTLAALVAILDASGGGDLTPAELVRVRVLTAEIARAMGDEAAAERALDAALAIDAELTLDPALAPPPLLASLEARRLAIQRCALAIETLPSDGVVVIDGRRGSAGLLALPCGDHFLRVEADGYVTNARTLTLRPSETPTALEIGLVLDAREALAAPGAPFTAIAPSLREAAEMLGGGLVVLDLERGADGRARARLVGLDHDAEVRSTGGGDEIARSLLAGPEALEEDPWPWVALGVGIAVVVASAIALGAVLSESTPSRFGIRGSISP